MNLSWRAWEALVRLIDPAGDSPALGTTPDRRATTTEFWTRLISIANEHLVTASLWSGLRRARATQLVPSDFQEYLESFHEYNTARNRSMVAQLDECGESLNRAGIEPVLLKGAAYLASGLYDDLGDRYLSDIDLLVSPDAAERAHAVLLELGYRSASDRDYSNHHHFAPLVRDGAVAAIELHTAAVPRSVSPALSFATVFKNSISDRTFGRAYRLPSPTDASMLLFLHAVTVDRNFALFVVPLRLMLDAVRLQRLHAAGIDWTENLQRAAAIGGARDLRRYLYILERLFGRQQIDYPRRSLGDAIHYGLCAVAVSWSGLSRWGERIDRLGVRRGQPNPLRIQT